MLAHFGENYGTTDITEYKEIYGMPYLKCIVTEGHIFDYIKENATRE